MCMCVYLRACVCGCVCVRACVPLPPSVWLQERPAVHGRVNIYSSSDCVTIDSVTLPCHHCALPHLFPTFLSLSRSLALLLSHSLALLPRLARSPPCLSVRLYVSEAERDQAQLRFVVSVQGTSWKQCLTGSRPGRSTPPSICECVYTQ